MHWERSTAWFSGRHRPLRVLAAVSSCVVVATTLSGCGAAGAPSALSSCPTITAVLSDGPDPQSDPVGYAEAQVQPLAQLSIADRSLASAVSSLSRAYASYVATKGSSAAAAAVTTAAAAVDALCPGATQ